MAAGHVATRKGYDPMTTAEETMTIPEVDESPFKRPDPDEIELDRPPFPRKQREIVFSVSELAVHYSQGPRRRGGHARHRRERDHRADRAVGVRQEHFIRCLNRMNDLIVGAKVSGHTPVPRHRPVRAQGRPGRGPAPHRDGVPEAEPLPEVDLRQHRVRARGSTARSAGLDDVGRGGADPRRRSGTRSRTS